MKFSDFNDSKMASLLLGVALVAFGYGIIELLYGNFEYKAFLISGILVALAVIYVLIKNVRLKKSLNNNAAVSIYEKEKQKENEYIKRIENKPVDNFQFELAMGEFKRSVENASNKNTEKIAISNENQEISIAELLNMIDNCNDSFFNVEFSIIKELEDGVQGKPQVNWVKVRNENISDAIERYISIKKHIDSNIDNKLRFHLDNSGCIENWLYDITFMIVNVDSIDLQDNEKSDLIKKCKENDIHIVKQKENEFYDLLEPTRYVLKYTSFAGSADDAATYVSYRLVKIDEKAAEQGKESAKKILHRILTTTRPKTGIGSAQYRKDIALGKNIMTIQLDEKRLYFLSVFINRSDDSIDKFSFDIENADDTHYEFDIFGAEKLRKQLINKSRNRKNGVLKSLDELMADHLKQHGANSLIGMIENISTAVFSF